MSDNITSLFPGKGPVFGPSPTAGTLVACFTDRDGVEHEVASFSEGVSPMMAVLDSMFQQNLDMKRRLEDLEQWRMEQTNSVDELERRIGKA